jgi:hypothetical protein
MNNIDEPKNMMGMARILADDGEDIDFEELDMQILGDMSGASKVQNNIDYGAEFEKEINSIIGGDTNDIKNNVSSVRDWEPPKPVVEEES